MELPQTYLHCVRFARFCIDHQLDPVDVAELCLWARRAFAARELVAGGCGGQWISTAEIACIAVEAKAQLMGITVQWLGLWPTVTIGNKECLELPINNLAAAD